MSFRSLKIDEFKGFGRRLMALARKKEYNTAESIATVIYENDKYREMVTLRNGKSKGNFDSHYKQKDGIKRIIQKHINEEDVKKIPSAYLYVYSEIFNCSLDYLYGKTNVSTVDLNIADICKKTGLSESAVVNLINESDNGNFPLSSWWSDILSGESFSSIPISWRIFADSIVMLNDIEKKAEAYEKAAGQIKDDEIFECIELCNADALRSLLAEKESSMYGTYYAMVTNCEHILKRQAVKWASEQHPDYDKMYYQGELDKIKILKTLEPVNNTKHQSDSGKKNK